MNNLALLQAGLKTLWVVFAFAFGASAGSLINVLVYRLPRGLDVVWTGSRCPCCQTKLTWRENIPVFGWLFLGGRCRFCRSKISAEYPLVELLVGLLWVGMFVVYYLLPQKAAFCGVDWAALRPEWAVSDALEGWPRTTWPIFITHLFVVASLVAMTLVDAKTYTIPLVLPWAALVVGVAFHTLGGVLVQNSWTGGLLSYAPGACWSLPTPNWMSEAHTSGNAWWWTGAAIGGTVGIVAANLLLHFGLIRRSFADYPAWEREQLKSHGIDPDKPQEGPDEGIPVGEHVGPGVRAVLMFVGVWLICLLGLGYAGWALGPGMGRPRWAGLAVGFLGGPLVAGAICRLLSPKREEKTEVGEGDPSQLWIAYPHARREMMKELIFLTPVIGLGWVGGIVAQHLCGAQVPSLWLMTLAGSLMGALIGGGVVWAIRIGGSLAFGKEAMGLGDVHMMAGVGACLGWFDAAIAVPVAAFVGLWFVIVSLLAGWRAGRTMPFGPYLAVGTLLVMFGKPLIEWWLTRLLGQPVNLP